MSLLNDALKRASQSQQEHDTVRIHLPAACVAAPKPKAGLGWALPVLVILLIITFGAFCTLAILARKPAAPILTASVVPPPIHAAPARPKPAPPQPVTPTVAVTAPAPIWPPLKLQGITYYNAKWQAIVNGTTVYVGQSVNGFRVAMISRNTVSFIAPDGSHKILALGQ